MNDCPNCGAQVDDGVRICPNCGFDTAESQAEDVRRLRQEGKIHPGRLGATDRNDFASGDPHERAPHTEELPAEDTPLTDPKQIEGGF